jgi:hypothetical protein
LLDDGGDRFVASEFNPVGQRIPEIIEDFISGPAVRK